MAKGTSEHHYFHLFSAADVVLSTQGSFNSKSAIVLAPDSKDRRHLVPDTTVSYFSGFNVYLN